MSRADARHHQAERLLDRLKSDHGVLKHFRPLDEAQVEVDLAAAHPDAEDWLLQLALHLHLNSDGYLQALAHGGPRYDLAGNPAGEVEADTRHHARALLKHHRAHKAKKRG